MTGCLRRSGSVVSTGLARLTAGMFMLLVVWLLAGCASLSTHPQDPLERYNRGVTDFNEQVDAAVLKPVAVAYTHVTPSVVRTGVRNFFANLGDVWSFANHVLQLRMEAATASFMRVNVNTLFGLGGVLDVASDMGIDRYRSDFGLTLGRWGVPTGPYVVLPILGPSTVRDTFALPVDMWGGAVGQVDTVSVRNSLYALRAVDTRANLLRASNVLDSAALDKYSFTRDVFLQLRQQASESAKGLDAQADTGGAGVLPLEPEP